MVNRTAGVPKFDYFPKAASTAFAVGELVAFDGSGAVVPAATGDAIVGVCKREVTSAAADYTALTPIAIDVNTTPDGEFEIDANGTVTAAMIGTYKDLADSETLDVGAATNNDLLVVGIGSTTTKARVRIHAQAMVA